MEQLVLHGRKGGDSKASTPVEQKNNLLSKSYAKVLLAIGEGEFAGVPTAKDIYLDGTPLVSESGLQNFGGVKWEFRSGRSDQSYITGMPDLSSEFNVGFVLTNETPYTRLISNSQLDAFRVTLSWPGLYQQKDNGDIVGYNIEYAIDVSTNGGAFVEQGKWDTNSGKTTVEYNRTHRISLPKPGTSWTLRIRRITANQNNAKFADAMQVKTYAEVIDAKLRFPNTALLYMEFDAELFGGTAIPKISLRTKGRYVQVPANYSPESRSYNGVWNGTFKWAWSNNPAWVFYDLVVNERFGLGSRVKPDMVDKWTLYQVAQYCDVLVPDGQGGTEPRYTCNMYIQARKEAWQVLRDIIGIFNGMLFWSGTQMVASADMPVAVNTIRTYNRSNVVDGKFNYGSTSEKTIYTTALVSFDDPSNHYETAVEAVNDLNLVQRYKTWAQAELSAIGCTSRGQAQRKGKYTMLTNSLNRLVTFKLGLEGYLPRPGEVFGVADQVLAGSNFAGRVSNATLRTVTLDRVPNAVAGDILYINKADGTTGEGRTVLSIAGQVVTVTADYTAVPSTELGWYIEKTTLKSQLYRATKVTWNDDAAQYEIQGVQYEDSKYAAVDTGARLESRPITNIPAGGQDAPTGLTLSSFSFIEQMMAVTTLSVKWNPTPGAMNYEGQWRKDGGEWNNVGQTTSTGFDVKGIYSGAYQARVRAINVTGTRSVWTESANTTLNGKVGAPPTLVNFTTTPELFAIRIGWAFQDGAGDGAYIELQEADNIQGANARQLTLATYPAITYLKSGMAAGVVKYFRGRLIDRTGNQGAWTAWTYGISETDADKILDAIAGEVEKSALGKELLSDIELITNSAPGSVNVRVNDVKQQVVDAQTKLNGQIESVGTQLTTVKQDLQKQIDTVSQLTDSMPYKANTAYKIGQSVLGTDGIIYQALKDVPVNNAPPNTTYWLNVGQVIRDSNGLAARVNTTESKIMSIEGVNTSQGTAITGLNNSLTNKADASALQTVATKVTAAEDKITSQGQTLTNLQNTVAGKADASALAGLSNTVTQQGTNLTTASNNIVALSNNLSNAGGENLTYNPDFLKPGADGTVADGYLTDAPGSPGSSTGVFSLVTSWMNSAEKAQRIAVTGLNVSALYRSIRNSPNRLPKVAEGQASCSSIYVRGTAGLGFRIFIQQINASGGLLTTTPSAMFYLTEATQRIALATPSPVAGCVALVMFYRVYGSDTVSNGYIEMARPQVEYGNVPTGWSNNAQVVANDQSATSNAVSSLSSLVDQQGSALTSTSNNIVTLTNSLKAANSAGDNIVSNATFDPAFDQMGFTVFASTATGVPANCPFKYVAKLSSRDHLPTVSSVPFVATKPGDVWRMSALVACGAGTSPFQLYARKGSDPSTSVSTLQGGASTAATSTWTRATYDLTIPAGTFFFQPFLQIEQNASGGATTWYATDWHVENISAAKAAQTTADAAAGAVSSLNSTVDQQGNAITSMSSNIVNLTNNITTAGGENLLYNPSFEVQHPTAVGSPDGWAIGGPASTFAYSLVDSTYDPGTKAQRVEGTGMTTSTYVDLSPRVEYRPGVSAGQILTLSAFVKGTPGIGFQLFMQHRNAAGTVLATSSQGVTSLSDGWQRVTLTSAPLPEGTVNTGPIIRLRPNSSGSIGAGFMIVDKAQLEVGAVATGWHDNTKTVNAAQTATSTALAGLTSTVNQQGNSITSTSQDVVSLNNTISRTGDNNPTRVYDSLFSAMALDKWQPNGANPGSAATATFSNVAGNTSGATLTIDCTRDLNHWWGDSTRRIKFDPTRLYKFSVRVNQIAKNGRDPATYIGVDVFNENNQQISTSGALSLVSSHYLLVAGGKLTENTWMEFSTYVKGYTTGSEAGGSGAGTIADPKRIKSGGVYMSPMILSGHSFQGGLLALDYFRIEDVTDQVQIDATANSLQTLTNKVTQQGNTLTSNSTSITDLNTSIATMQGAISASGLDPAPNALWNFDTSVEGWTAGNASLSAGTGFVTLTATSGDPTFVSPGGLNITGALYNRVRAKITRRAGAITDWDGQLFYARAGYSWDANYTGYAANPNLAIGQSAIVEFDMSTRPSGIYRDWTVNTITQIRLDFGAANGSSWEIDWVAIGRIAPAASSRAVQYLDSTVTQQGNTITSTANQLNQLSTYVGNVAAVVSNETTARSNGDTALSQRIDQVQATAGNASAAVQQTSSALANLDGAVNAQYSVKVMTMSNGMKVAAGFGIGLQSDGGVSQATFAVSADRFAVLNNNLNGTLFSPFSIENGQVFISDAFIKKATIQNLLVSADINSSLTTAQGLPMMQVITRDAQIILRHGSRADTFTLTNRDGMQVYVDGRLRVRMGIW